MRGRLGAFSLGLAALVGLASLGRGVAQEPALSGLNPPPTPASAVSFTPAPTPAVTHLSGGRSADSGVVGRGGSLADIVKISQEARKGQPAKKSLGTITNDNVRKGATPAPAPAKAATAGKGAAAAAAKSATGATPTPWVASEIKDDKGRTEADWRALVSQKTALVTNGEAQVRDLETKSKQLENDFYAMSDGNRRDAVVKPAWDKARDDLARARQNLEEARKALDDLAEEARKSDTPPGWLR